MKRKPVAFALALAATLGFLPRVTMAFRVTSAERPFGSGEQNEAHRLTVAKPEDAFQHPGGSLGDVLPDFSLVNQDGEVIKLGQYRGRTLILTFIYTRCSQPTYCRLTMRNFQKLDEGLSADPALFAKTHLLSISFDSAFDTPEVLRSFGQAFVQDRGQGRFGHWELATGSAEQVKGIAEFFFFGLVDWGEEGQISHTLCTAIVGPDGKVGRVYRDNQWTVGEALREARRVTR